MKNAILCLLLIALVFSPSRDLSVSAIDHPEDFVNLLAGTFTDGDRFSTGNTLPLIGRPWGFNHWSPQTKEGNRRVGSWWFKGSDHQFTWMRCTHQPSPWIGDWGWFLFSPQMGSLTRNPTYYWEPRGAVIKPHLFDATFSPNGLRIELTPSMHGAMLRVSFPPVGHPGIGPDTEKRICFAEAEWGSHTMSPVPTLTGRATQVSQDRMLISNFGLHIRAVSESASEVEIRGDMTCFRYKPSTVVAVVRIATSLISGQQAEVNLNREVGLSKGFDELALETRRVWNKLLRRVDVSELGHITEATARHLTVFYTGLARALSFPRRIDEVTADGKMVHYSPYDPRGGVHDGPSVTDNGFWDTFRTVYPMLSLLYPDLLGDIIQGWLNAYKEGGWLPSWASPGYRNCMVGTYADVVVADAVVKGVKGFDLNTARDAMLKDSFTEPPRMSGGAVGKEGLGEYSSRGYFPNNNGDEVSRTLDFGFADYSVSKALDKLASLLPDPSSAGATDDTNARRQKLTADAQTLAARSKRAQSSLYDKNHGLMVPKDDRGQTIGSYREIEWGFGFVEGNSWHHSFPPYALENLVDLHGGSVQLLAKLHNLLDRPSDFLPGSYNQEIHEMTEARAFGMGQYSHNNQPVHHILYLFAELGDRAATEKGVRTVMEKGYGTDFYAGDEDNGEQGAWFVLSALGLFSTVPGSPLLVLGSPIFKHVRIWRGKCETNPSSKVVTCDYSDEGGPAKEGTGLNILGFGRKSKGKRGGVHQFPPGSSYLDIVALGTSLEVSKVAEITLNGEQLPPAAIYYSRRSFRLEEGAKPPNMASINDALLQRDGVLRFVMDGERVDGTLAPFSREGLLTGSAFTTSDSSAEDRGDRGGGVPVKTVTSLVDPDKVKDRLISSLREELKHEHEVEEELRSKLQHEVPGDHSLKGEKQEGGKVPGGRPKLIVKKLCAVVGLLLLISLVAVLLAHLSEYLGIVEKKDKKEAHVV